MTNPKPTYNLVDGEPVCSSDCEFYSRDKCTIRGHGIYLTTVIPTFSSPCIPGLREQRDQYKAENERLEKGLKNAMEMIIKLRELLSEDEK